MEKVNKQKILNRLANETVANMGDVFFDHDPKVGESDPSEDALTAVKETLEKVLTPVLALLSDIEAMDQGNDDYGPFTCYEMTEVRHTGEEALIVEWPNLTVSATKLKQALEGKE